MKGQKSTKDQLLIAGIIALWLVLFLIWIAPFDISELSLKARIEIMPVYGVIAFVAYLLTVPLENAVFDKLKNGPIYLEVLILFVFNILALLGSYLYYKSGVVNGNYSLTAYIFQIYYPIFFIILPTIIFARWLIGKIKLKRMSDHIVLIGDNKLDILQLRNEDLISISSTDNYISVAYLANGTLAKKLLRATLKNIETQLPELVRVHRSHLINPLHFKQWKDATTIELTNQELPVSKNYKKHVLAMNHSSQKRQ